MQQRQSNPSWVILLVGLLFLLGQIHSQQAATRDYATHEEKLNLNVLKTHSDQSEFNHLVEHVYEIRSATTKSENDFQAPGIAGMFFEKASRLKELKSFKLSFALGNLAYEESFGFAHQLPRFGSFLYAEHNGGPKELVELGFLLSTFFGLANGRITSFERMHHKELGISWYSYAPEHFCVDQLYKVLKFYPNQHGLFRLLTDDDIVLFRYSYASVEIEYNRGDSKSGQTLKFTLRGAIPDSQMKKLLGRQLTPASGLDPRSNSGIAQKWPSITKYDHYQEKVLELDVQKLLTNDDQEVNESPVAKDQFTLGQLQSLAKSKKAAKLPLQKQSRLFQVDRFVRGRISSFNNTLVHLIKGNAFQAVNPDGSAVKSQRFRLKLLAVSDSHQHFFLSDIKVTKVEEFTDEGSSRKLGQVIAHDAKYVIRLPKPNSNLPITAVEITFELGSDEAVELTLPYLINLRKVSEYEQEYERGTYILGSVAQVFLLTGDGSNSSVQNIILPPLLRNEKMIDSTFAFTTLTINNVVFFILPITIMFLGISVS